MTSPRALCDAASTKLSREGFDVEKIRGFDGEGNSGAGDFLGRRGWADLRRIRGCPARVVSSDGDDVGGNARGRSRASRPSAGDVPPTLWRAHTPDPARKCERVSDAAADLAGAAFGRERGQEAGRSDGTGGATLLPARHCENDGRFNAGIIEQAGGRGTQAHPDGRKSGEKSEPDRPAAGGRIAPEIVFAAGGATRAGGVDGRIGFPAGAVVCGGVCYPQELGCVSGGTGSVGRCRYLDGICGGVVG